MMQRAFFLVAFAGICGCTGAKQQSLEFPRARLVVPGTTSSDQVTQLFGAPSEKIATKNGKGELWYYSQGELRRLGISLVRPANVVESVTWDVFEKEPTESLQAAMGLFPGANWQVTSPTTPSAHLVPAECLFEDSKRGITIEYRPRHQVVSSISWWDPARQPASAEPQTKRPNWGNCRLP